MRRDEPRSRSPLRHPIEAAALTYAALPGNDPLVDDFVGRSGSLLGQLELGLGAGFLAALEAPSDEVCAMVLDCVDRDTRLDWNLDERADYYALLLLAADADVAAVEGVVAANEPVGEDPKDHSTLPLDVLVRMGVRGSRNAQDAVGRYLAEGTDVAGLLCVLQGDGERMSEIPGWRSAIERLGAVFCERFPSHVELRSALESTREGFWIGSDAPPWSLWAASHPMVADVLREYDEATGGKNDRGGVPDLASLSTPELLAVQDGRLGMAVFAVLKERTDVADVRSLIAAARFESLPMQGPAIRALAYQHRAEALEIAVEHIDDPPYPRLRGHLFRALVLLPYDQTRSLAHEWLQSSEGSRPGVAWHPRIAAAIFEEHAEAEDIPVIREYLCRDTLERATSDFYVICSLAGALGRHPNQGPYPELTSIFYGMSYSYGRLHVARAMAETDPAFANTQAVECLWDCQPTTRDFGATYVDVDNPIALARLHVIASDPAEDEETQRTARSRVDHQQTATVSL
jgi:hypothetical protein